MEEGEVLLNDNEDESGLKLNDALGSCSFGTHVTGLVVYLNEPILN